MPPAVSTVAIVSVHSAEVEQKLCMMRRLGIAFDSSGLWSFVLLNGRRWSRHRAAVQKSTREQSNKLPAAELHLVPFGAENRWAVDKDIEGRRVRIACVYHCYMNPKLGQIECSPHRMSRFPEMSVDSRDRIVHIDAEPT